MGHPQRRQREHGKRCSRAHRGAWRRSQTLRAAGDGRCGPRARLPRGQEARDQPADRAPGAGGRLGARAADCPARVDRVATIACEMDQIAWPELEATFTRLEVAARSVLAATAPDCTSAMTLRLADIRYVGQA